MADISPNLLELIDQWVKDDPQLHHFHIKRLSWTWLICECIDHAWNEHPGYRITKWNVEVYKPWMKYKLYPGDPDFFSKLKNELVQCCVEAQAYGTT